MLLSGHEAHEWLQQCRAMSDKERAVLRAEWRATMEEKWAREEAERAATRRAAEEAAAAERAASRDASRELRDFSDRGWAEDDDESDDDVFDIGAVGGMQAKPALTERVSPLPEILSVFNEYDKDRSGDIDASELRAALTALGLSVTGPQAAALLAKYDHDSSAVLEIDEFERLVRELSRSQPPPPRAAAAASARGAQDAASKLRPKSVVRASSATLRELRTHNSRLLTDADIFGLEVARA